MFADKLFKMIMKLCVCEHFCVAKFHLSVGMSWLIAGNHFREVEISSLNFIFLLARNI